MKDVTYIIHLLFCSYQIIIIIITFYYLTDVLNVSS